MKGELLASAGTADVYAFGAGRVGKLFRPEFAHAARTEAARTRAVRAGGAPSPRVYDEIELDGRRGIVMERISGPTLLSELGGGLPAAFRRPLR